MKTVIIFGATGSIGNAFVNYFLKKYENINLILAYRNKENFIKPKINLAQQHIKTFSWNGTIENDTKNIADYLKEKNIVLDYCVNASGALHSNTHMPEKRLADFSAENFTWYTNQNTITHALVLKHIIPFMNSKSASSMFCLSARIGSISDNHLGGWYSYRASKAALNMLIKTASIESKRRNKTCCILAIHPGTVDSYLSTPFKANVKPEKLFSAEKSINLITTHVFPQATIENTGKIFAYDGQEILP